jgi:hypothetical protein
MVNPYSRNWDGSPETASDTRFHDLRQSGWTGPIDQDGNRVDDLDEWINERLHQTRRPATLY